jgi:hypothetical protein
MKKAIRAYAIPPQPYFRLMSENGGGVRGGDVSGIFISEKPFIEVEKNQNTSLITIKLATFLL